MISDPHVFHEVIELRLVCFPEIGFISCQQNKLLLNVESVLCPELEVSNQVVYGEDASDEVIYIDREQRVLRLKIIDDDRSVNSLAAAHKVSVFVDELEQVDVSLVLTLENLDGLQFIYVPDVYSGVVPSFSTGHHPVLGDTDRTDFRLMMDVVRLFVDLEVVYDDHAGHEVDDDLVDRVPRTIESEDQFLLAVVAEGLHNIGAANAVHPVQLDVDVFDGDW